jgi:hypothetical protein
MEMSSTRTLPFWKNDKSEVCRQIARRQSPFKIVLKTKNESHFIEEWIDHHAKIVGLQNLIIFDNMSTSPEVLEFYDRLPDDVVVVRYDGFHNLVHVVEVFPELYAALAGSCTFFSIIDTDEFLMMVDSKKRATAQDVLPFMLANGQTEAFPGTWLVNAPYSRSIFKIGTTPGMLEGALRWGKPIVRASDKLKGIILHNTQLDRSFYTAHTSSRLFLLHMTELYPEQRIRANVDKLVARKFAAVGERAEDVVLKDTAGIEDNNVHLYVTEIKRLLTADPSVPSSLASGTIEVKLGEPLGHFSSVEEGLIDAFLNEGTGSVVDRILAQRADEI